MTGSICHQANVSGPADKWAGEVRADALGLTAWELKHLGPGVGGSLAYLRGAVEGVPQWSLRRFPSRPSLPKADDLSLFLIPLTRSTYIYSLKGGSFQEASGAQWLIVWFISTLWSNISCLKSWNKIFTSQHGFPHLKNGDTIIYLTEVVEKIYVKL